jgi:hypothetical protein
MGLYALRLLDQRVVRAGFDHLALGAGFAEPGLEPQVFGGAQQDGGVYGVTGGNAELVGQGLRVGGDLVETGDGAQRRERFQALACSLLLSLIPRLCVRVRRKYCCCHDLPCDRRDLIQTSPHSRCMPVGMSNEINIHHPVES